MVSALQTYCILATGLYALTGLNRSEGLGLAGDKGCKNMEQTRDIRREYTFTQLRRADLAAQPLQQFEVWLQQALAGAVEDATAMTVATVDGAGQPSARIVLL